MVQSFCTMNARIALTAEPRTVLGKKVRQLRPQGKIPSHVYGRGLPSVSITIPVREFEDVYRKVGETGVLSLAYEDTDRPVLIQGVQEDPLTGKILHVDFYQVNLREKVRVAIPIELVGESPAVASKKAVLEQPLSEVEVEALPDDLPERIAVDISGLEKIDDQVTAADLVVDRAKVTVLNDPESVVVKTGPLLTEEMERALEEEKAAAQAAAKSDLVVAEEVVQAPIPPTEGEAQESTQETKDSASND